MQIRMKVELSGTHNGQPYPPLNVPTEVDDALGAQLCAKGLATPVNSRGRAETATMPEPETRTLTTAKGPGRGRKEETS